MKKRKRGAFESRAPRAEKSEIRGGIRTEESAGQMPQKTGSRAGLLMSLISAVLTFALLLGILCFAGNGTQNPAGQTAVADVGTKFQQYAANLASNALDGVITLRRTYQLDDNDLMAPVPNPQCYGEADSLEEIAWLSEEAAELLEGDSLYCESGRVLRPDSKVTYYLDDTILAVTWKEVVGNVVFTFSEVKIAHGSQFRRFLAGGEFGSEKRFPTTEMAESVNAVVASSGDFYKFRYNGVVVYGNTVRRVNTNKADTCYIDGNGDLHFTYQNAAFTMEEAQKYVDENDIRFSLTFGPVLVDNGVRCEPDTYDLGEVNDKCPRAALCQMGTRHYLLVTSNAEPEYPEAITIHTFAERIAETGCEKGYALDGGQTAAIAMNNQLMNAVLFGQQRPISDIIYFATALPNGG